MSKLKFVLKYIATQLFCFCSQLFIASTPGHWCRIPELDPWYNDVPELLKSLRFDAAAQSENLNFNHNLIFSFSLILKCTVNISRWPNNLLTM